MNETWRDIPGYEGLYKASDLGRIKNAADVITVGIKEYSREATYPTCILKKDGFSQTYVVHRLILLAFVPNSHNKPQGNHINHIKNDNRLVNLEWVTQSENMKAAVIFYKANPKLKPSYLRHLRYERGFKTVEKHQQGRFYSDYVYLFDRNKKYYDRCNCEDW